MEFPDCVNPIELRTIDGWATIGYGPIIRPFARLVMTQWRRPDGEWAELPERMADAVRQYNGLIIEINMAAARVTEALMVLDTEWLDKDARKAAALEHMRTDREVQDLVDRMVAVCNHICDIADQCECDQLLPLMQLGQVSERV